MVERFESQADSFGTSVRTEMLPPVEQETTNAADKKDSPAPAGKTGEQQVAERPSWLPEQFKTVEDYNKSYDELRKDHTRKSQELAQLKKDPLKAGEEANKPVETVVEDQEITDATEGAKQALESVGLDLTEFSTEYETAGEISEESLAKLESKGISRAHVEAYIEGINAIRERSEGGILKSAGIGGRDEYNQIIQWAGQNLDKEFIQAYDEAVTNGGVAQAKMAVSSLYAKYVAANGKEPTLVQGGGQPSQGVYNSTAEMTADMSDPRYKRGDEAFHAQVRQKLSNSRRAGTIL